MQFLVMEIPHPNFVYGEAPGRYEDEQGLPFVGRAGRLLDSLLESINPKPSEVFIPKYVEVRHLRIVILFQMN
ncbi:MAG: hypothetical protein CM1200mP38_0930 [Dehalococcoidia bacterium]|nr:MAG: hypothetical protein CM1200mP38_0930 [Dehalococcoidia bacterium]